MFKRFSAGFAVGYVFGAQAGQKRYEQITDLAEKALDLPVVGQAAGRAQELFTPENGRRFLGSLRDRMASGRGDDDDEEDSDVRDSEDGDSEEEDFDDEAAYDGDAGEDEDDDYEAGDGDEDEDVEPAAEYGDEDGDDDQGDADDSEPDDGDRADEPGSAAGRSRSGSRKERPPRQKRQSGGRPRRQPEERARSRSGAGRIGSLASAALERGRVD